MPKKRNHLQKVIGEKRARSTKTILAFIFIGLLVTLVLVLLFGDILESAGMQILRKSLIAILIMLLVSLVFMAPIITEFNRDPRPLSGPGKDPRTGWDQWK